MIENSINRKIFNLANFILLSGFCMIILLPLWMVLATSLGSDAEVIKKGYVFFPQSIDFKYYLKIVNSGYMGAFLRSIAITAAGTVFSMVLTLMAGYALTRKDLKGRGAFLNFIIVTMLFDSGIIPLYMLVRALGLIDSYFSLVLPVAISTYNLVLVKNFMTSLPASLVESGRIDGCSEMSILFRIIIPVSIPIIAAISLFYAVYYWNMYFEVVIFINSSAKYTLQVLLRQLVFESESVAAGTQQIYNNFKMSVMVMAMLPILILYPFLQRYFVTGIMLGSIKG